MAALLSAATLALGGCAHGGERPSHAELTQQVIDTERAFAKTMADRDHAAFAAYLADEAVFFADDKPLRGKQAVADAWRRYFEKPEAPFAWQPEIVEVLGSGSLALSTGPVRDAQGRTFATFTSIWRRRPSGGWQIVFDKGNAVCDCVKP